MQRKQHLLLCRRLRSCACTRLVQFKAFLLAALQRLLSSLRTSELIPFVILSKTQGKFTGSDLFSVQMITHLFWSRSCCSGVKDSETSAELLSGFGLDWKPDRLQLYWGHVYHQCHPVDTWVHCIEVLSCMFPFHFIYTWILKYFFTLLKCIYSRQYMYILEQNKNLKCLMCAIWRQPLVQLSN